MSDALLAASPETAAPAATTPAPEQSAKPVQPTDAEVAGKFYKAQEPETPPAETETKPEVEPEKPAEEKPAEETAEPEAKKKNAPELYEFDIPKGMPKDFQMDAEVFDALGESAYELDLSQEQAQGLVDKVWPVMQRRAEEQQQALHESLKAQTKADPEIGGSKLEENLGKAKLAVKTFASDGLRELLNGPLGSHPEVVRFLVKVGQTVSEDSFVGGGPRRDTVDMNDPASIARKLYPNTPME